MCVVYHLPAMGWGEGWHPWAILCINCRSSTHVLRIQIQGWRGFWLWKGGGHCQRSGGACGWIWIQRELPLWRQDLHFKLSQVHISFKSPNKKLQISQQLTVPTKNYKSSNNKTVPNNYKGKTTNLPKIKLQISQQKTTNLPTINGTNKKLQIFQQ